MPKKAFKVTVSILAVALAIVGLMMIFLESLKTPRTEAVTIIQPKHLGGNVYVFETPDKWPQYAASLAAFRENHPELECHRDGGYRSGTYHIVSCSDPAVDAQSITIP